LKLLCQGGEIVEDDSVQSAGECSYGSVGFAVGSAFGDVGFGFVTGSRSVHDDGVVGISIVATIWPSALITAAVCCSACMSTPTMISVDGSSSGAVIELLLF
jgi:hypothetical protein